MSIVTAPTPTTTIEFIEQRIAPLRARLTAHPLYASIRTAAQLRVFMESHVFAVWDFMSLLKSLQAQLTCVQSPWVPTRFPASRRFINEIVLGEESDEYQGRAISHFELYLEAMRQAGADTTGIERVLASIAQGSFDTASFDATTIVAPAPAQQFVATTFRIIEQGSLAAQAAAFTFGREDVIPDMFRELVRDLNQQHDGALDTFVWYLERHIEVDGEDHGPLSLRMVADLCGNDEALWEEAATTAAEALEARLALWDGIHAQILA
jgi:hypothetical protein